MDQLKIRVEDIPEQGMTLALEIAAEEVEARLSELEGEPLSVAAPLTIRLQLAPTGARIVTRGSIRTAIRSGCARCLDEFEQPVNEAVFTVFAPDSELDRRDEREAEALNQELYSGEEIDLWPVVQEQIILAVPIKPLCREDCQGLCPDCGRNRNQGSCDCGRTTGHPGLAGLEALRDKLPR
ncbi:MAG: DUF177 domain-containing protein [Proteobacteria bacterium]|nr:DUF177 domain-containing protein [Pseudomonadota bacterium]